MKFRRVSSMIVSELAGLNLLEIYLEKARYFHSQGLYDESLKFLANLKNSLHPNILGILPASICEKIIDAEIAICLATQGDLSLCEQTLKALTLKEELTDDNSLIAHYCIMLSACLYHLEIYDIVESIKHANVLLDFFENPRF